MNHCIFEALVKPAIIFALVLALFAGSTSATAAVIVMDFDGDIAAPETPGGVYVINGFRVSPFCHIHI